MSEANQLRGQITEQVIQTIGDFMAEILGKPVVNRLLKVAKDSGDLSGSKLMYAFAEETQGLLGDKGSYATMRQVGRRLAKTLMQQHPKEQWEQLLEESLNDFGFARAIEHDKDRAFICNCVFYDTLQDHQLQPTQHAVCWAGWGFIEGFMRELQGIKSIQWVGRDVEGRRCEFDFRTE